MNLRQLTYVVEISRCGSISGAAKKLFLAQSSISASIKELEDELGIEIFKRNNRGVIFTRAGKEFLSYATSLLEHKEHIESIYMGKGGSESVHFAVSTQRYPFSEDAFIKLLKQTSENRFHFFIREANMDVVIDDVYNHRSDIGVIFLSNTTEKYIRRMLSSRGIEFNKVMSLTPCVFLRCGHPLTKKRSVTAADLSGYVYLSFEHEQGVAMDFSEEFHLFDYKKPPRVVNVNDRAMAVNVIASTDAITSGSGLLVEGLMDTRMISIPIEGEDQMQVGWIRAKNQRLSRQAQLFVELFKKSMTDSVEYTERVRAELTGCGNDEYDYLTELACPI